MRTHSYKGVEFYISDDKCEKDLEDEILMVWDSLVQNISPTERTYIDLFRSTLGVEYDVIVLAHGGCFMGEWWIKDGDHDCLLQELVNILDGRFGTIMLWVCNPGHCTVRARRSLLMMPDNTLSSIRLSTGQTAMSLVHPREGDLGYTIEYELARHER